MPITRRTFLTHTAFSLAALGIMPLDRIAFAGPRASHGSRRNILVVVFLRGAADGLNVVVPHGESAYYTLRPTIALDRPGVGEASAIDLDGHFGLHPGLAPLKAAFDARELAIVNAVGSPDRTRSHFDAQDYMESGTPGSKATEDGWLNRYLQHSRRADATPFRAVAVAPRMPRTLAGPATALVIDDLRGFSLAADSAHPRARAFAEAVERAYRGSPDRALAQPASEMFDALHVLESRDLADQAPRDGVDYPKGPLGKSLSQTARLIQADLGVELAFVEVGGWDHHVNEGGIDGQLARSVTQLGRALAAFRQDLGDRMGDVVVVTMSEFGRTARENGNRGTDHGHGSFMLVMGGPVRGGKVHGRWPGLTPGDLFEERDLAVTTDFRTVLSEIVQRHLHCDDVREIFPNHGADAGGRPSLLS